MTAEPLLEQFAPGVRAAPGPSASSSAGSAAGTSASLRRQCRAGRGHGRRARRCHPLNDAAD